MIKAIPNSYDYGEPAILLIKRARYRMGANDRRELLKRASEEFVDKIARLEPKPGDVLAHNIALGSTDKFGSNRNGDGFKAAECRKNHYTFVKFARAYREHANQNPARSYGVVKLSHFNEAMHRIELAIAYNATKEAAERNGGLVAGEELEALEKDGTFPTSMATRLPYDVCSSCGNKARSRAEYCHGAMCKHGGLRHNIGKTFADGHTLHADNPNNCWFDISKVKRGADRTSHTLGMVEKAASAVKSGAELAEEYGLVEPIGLPYFDGPAADYLKIAAELACRPVLEEAWAGAFDPEVQPALLHLPDLRSHSEKLARSLQALAAERVVLPVRDFLAVLLGDVKEAAEVAPLVAPHVPAAYDELIASGGDAFAESVFLPARGVLPQATRAWAEKLAADYGLARDVAARRVRLASVRRAAGARNNLILKVAAPRPASSAVRALARQYVLYKVAALAAMQDSPDFDWLVRLAAVQDRAG